MGRKHGRGARRLESNGFLRFSRSLRAREPLRKVNQAFPEDWSSWFRKYALRHQVRIVFLQRRNDLRRIFSVEANRKIPVYATKDAGEATKVRHSKIHLDVKNLTKDLLRPLGDACDRRGLEVTSRRSGR